LVIFFMDLRFVTFSGDPVEEEVPVEPDGGDPAEDGDCFFS